LSIPTFPKKKFSQKFVLADDVFAIFAVALISIVLHFNEASTALIELSFFFLGSSYM